VGFPVVRVDGADARGKRLGQLKSYHLPSGNHFEALPEGVRPEALWFEDDNPGGGAAGE
jgi:hypothetical protein